MAASKEHLSCEGSSLSTAAKTTPLKSYLEDLESGESWRTDASSRLENLYAAVVNADAPWFYLGEDCSKIDGEKWINFECSCVELYTDLTSIIQQIGVVMEFTGREDRGYHADDFSAVPARAILCMKVFDAILGRLVEEKNSCEDKAENGARLMRKLVNAVSIRAFMLCLEHAEDHLWTSEQSTCASGSLIGQILRSTECTTVGDFLGYHQSGTSRFHTALLELKPKLSKSTWKMNPAAIEIFGWCVFNVGSSELANQLQLVLPPMLLLVDDFQVEHKCLGVRLLHHLTDKTSRTELSWHGRAQVIFDALRHQMYTHDTTLVRLLHPCLLAVLRVVEASPAKGVSPRKDNCYDEVLRQLLTDMELEDKLVMRRAYVEHLPRLLRDMGVNVVCHLVQLLRVVSAYLEIHDGPEEMSRLGALDMLKTVIVVAWPRMSFYCGDIVKCLLKLMYDVTVDPSLASDDVSMELVTKATECLQLLKRACPDEMQRLLGKLGEITLNNRWDKCIRDIID